MEQHPAPLGEILLYDNGEQKEFVSVIFQNETFWLATRGGGRRPYASSTRNTRSPAT